MKRSKVAILISSALVFGLALGSVGLAYAAEDGKATTDDGVVERMGRAVRGAGGGLLDTLAELTGLGTEEIREEAQAGKSLALIADENGVDSDAFIDELYQERKSHLDERLADGLITQEQYDWMLDHIAEQSEAAVLGDGPGFGPGAGMRGGPGGPGGGFGPGGGSHPCWDGADPKADPGT